MARHSHPGTLLAFDCGQADYYLDLPQLPVLKNTYDFPEFKADHEARFQLDKERLLLTRHRNWNLSDGLTAQDQCIYRLHRVDELTRAINQAGFEVLEISGDPTGKLQAPGERTLYVVARKLECNQAKG
jgi:hypothetical protein